MLYVDYVILKQSYDESLRRLKELLDKKEEAFTRTLPNAIRYDLTKVIHSVSTNSALDDYVMNIEAIEQEIRRARVIVYERKEMLNLKEEELKKSRDTDDRVYFLKYIQRLTVEQIAIRMHYSEGNIYYHLAKIKHQIKKQSL